MRVKRSRDESAAIELMRSALALSGHVVRDITDIIDRPDWVFELDGRRVGAEFTGVNLQPLMEWANYKHREDRKHYEVRFANEPHLWAQKAILDKNRHVPDYKQRSEASEIWLVMHAEFARLPLVACSDEMLAVMRAAVAATPSDFDAVWFAHSEAGAIRLWHQGDARCAFPEIDVSSRYPTLSVRQGVVALAPGAPPFSLGPHIAAETLVIPPLDPKFKL